MIIFDSSPLIHLTRIGKLTCLFELFGVIYIPKAVYNEFIIVGLQKEESDAVYLQNYYKNGKIKVISTNSEDPMIKDVLHQGEYECILLSAENDALMIMDDKKARFVAKEKNLRYHGTLGILYMMLLKKVIERDHYLENLKLFSEWSWISYSLYEKFRKLAEENGK